MSHQFKRNRTDHGDDSKRVSLMTPVLDETTEERLLMNKKTNVPKPS